MFLINSTVSMVFDRDVTAKSFMDFVHKGTGELTSSGCSASAFVSTSYAKSSGEADWPDVQFIFLGNGVYAKMHTDMSHGFHVDPTIMKKYLSSDLVGKDAFQIIVSLARPRARGVMRLSGKSLTDDLIIDPRYLDNEYDNSVLLEGVKMAVHLVENTTVFRKIDAKFTSNVFPGCEDVPFKSDEYWRCFIRQYSITLHHIVGPCSMGRNDSKDAVVDTRLRVLGVTGLRVIDASIFPKVPISNTNSATVMVGEKGSHFILQVWGVNSTRTQ
ncbi:glucose dehydrogenase [FAD, quinone]-like [Folsomia candida]|nr:glucose dehydrogenase [FAD, quinone]-like [Folsomia candida]